MIASVPSFRSAIMIWPKPMRLLSATLFLTLLAAACRADAAPLPAPSQVDIPAASLTLHAQLYKPDGDGPFPTVIALHGCGGLSGDSQPVPARYRDWAEQLLKTAMRCCCRIVTVRANSVRSAAPANVACSRAASGWPMSRHRGYGCCSNPGRRMTASA